ncbi:unnamed protein product [Heterobilharzia americana]|nr:unnamed protein product [Heterobilharzia americana]
MLFVSKCVQPFLGQKSCSMATLKDISVRLKSVKNIQKITASMKMVSAAKFARAERDLRPARPYGQGARAFYTTAELTTDKTVLGANDLIIAITSDRGLCGAANSSVVKAIRALLRSNPELEKSCKLVLIGDKSRALMFRQYRDMFLMTVNEVGRKAPTFEDASAIAQAILSTDFKFSKAVMFYNTFRTVVSYTPTQQTMLSLEGLSSSPNITIYDSVDTEILKHYNEFLLTSLIFSALKEATASEQSARMTAMDSATKNAGEMIERLTLTYNRTRQAAITRELTEIISGAAAV